MFILMEPSLLVSKNVNILVLYLNLSLNDHVKLIEMKGYLACTTLIILIKQGVLFHPEYSMCFIRAPLHPL